MERGFPDRVEALCETVLSTCAAILCIVVVPIVTLFAACCAALLLCGLIVTVYGAAIHDAPPTHIEEPAR